MEHFSKSVMAVQEFPSWQLLILVAGSLMKGDQLPFVGQSSVEVVVLAEGSEHVAVWSVLNIDHVRDGGLDYQTNWTLSHGQSAGERTRNAEMIYGSRWPELSHYRDC